MVSIPLQEAKASNQLNIKLGFRQPLSSTISISRQRYKQCSSFWALLLKVEHFGCECHVVTASKAWLQPRKLHRLTSSDTLLSSRCFSLSAQQ